MRILIDVNLSPLWVEALREGGIEAAHWTAIGDPRAKDRELMEWARSHDHVVFTHDLDFGAILAMTRALGPSIIQVRTQDLLPDAMGERVLTVLREHAAALESGAVVSIDEAAARLRILPIRPQDG